MKTKKIKAVITLEVTLTNTTIAEMKKFFQGWYRGENREIVVDQVVGAAKVQPVRKDD